MAEELRVVQDATCTFCGCVCDDMVHTVDDEHHKITKSENACVLGKAWFKEHGIEDRPANQHQCHAALRATALSGSG